MNPALIAAWLAGEAIVSWRIVHAKHRMPAPGELLAITGLFVGGALLADIFPRASPVIVMALFGLDVAAFLDVLPQGLAGQIQAAQQDEGSAFNQGNASAGTGQNPGTANITSRPG